MTGYTLGFLTGETETLEDFARVCARAFGATFHLKDKPLGTSLDFKTVNPFYEQEIKKTIDKIVEIDDLTDEELLTKIENDLKEAQDYLIEDTEKRHNAKIKFEEMREKVENWTPPSEKHQALKDFMINQLEVSLDQVNPNMHDKALEEVDGELATIDVAAYREKRIEEYKNQIEKFAGSQAAEIESAKESNEWIEVLTESFKK